MSSVASPRPFSHRHFGFDNPHALGAGRLSPLSHDSLVARHMASRREQARAEEDDWASEAESEDLLGTEEAEVPVDSLPTDGSMDLSDDVDL